MAVRLGPSLLMALLAAAPVEPQTTPPAPPGSPAATPPQSAPLAERLSWNARERTASGLDDYRAQRSDRARAAFDSALALRPDSPLTRYNAGTARIGSSDAEAAALLEQAARQAPPELAPEAWYNLGNAELGAGDAQAAARAYVEALKRKPDFAEAKFNLELALREAEKQREQQRQEGAGGRAPEREGGSPQTAPAQPDGSESESRRSGPESSESPGREGNRGPATPSTAGETPPSAPSDPASRDEDGAEPSSAPPTGGTPTPSGGIEKLPRFHDLPDMSAEQAAAILRAVDNLERAQRRAQAIARAKRQASEEKDW